MARRVGTARRADGRTGDRDAGDRDAGDRDVGDRDAAGRGPRSDARRLVAAVRRPYRTAMTPPQRSALVAWLSFGTTFGAVRVVTYTIRAGRGPLRDIQLGGRHVHHYVEGIAMVLAVGAVAVRGDAVQRLHPVVGACYGSGAALIVDEFALLLDLQDVYWAREGRWSVDLALLSMSAAGAYFAGLPVWRAFRREAAKIATERARQTRSSASDATAAVSRAIRQAPSVLTTNGELRHAAVTNRP
nr:hypothetical protein [Micromonospora sp. DSM 115978]